MNKLMRKKEPEEDVSAQRAQLRGIDGLGQADTAIPAVEVSQLRKTYPGGIEAVKGIDFEVAPGEVFGLLGPNGAGKSTTIGMLTTTVLPTAGTARLAGYDVAAQPLLARGVSSVVFQDAVVDAPLSGRANLELHARLWGVPKPVSRPADRGPGRCRRSHGADRPAGRELQRRSAPAARDRPRAGVGAAGPVPRRADGRPRSAHPARAARRDRRPAGSRGDDDRPHHPLPRRGRAAVRPGGDHPSKARSSRWTRPRAAGRARPRDPRVPRRAAAPTRRSPRCASGESPGADAFAVGARVTVPLHEHAAHRCAGRDRRRAPARLGDRHPRSRPSTTSTCI